MVKKELQYLKSANMLNSKIMKKNNKITSSFIIHAYFESILVPENNGMKNPEKSYTNQYQKHITCRYGYKLLCLDNKFNKPFKTYLGGDIGYSFFNNMIEEGKYCSHTVKKYFNKEGVMTKEDNENVGFVIMITLRMILE